MSFFKTMRSPRGRKLMTPTEMTRCFSSPSPKVSTPVSNQRNNTNKTLSYFQRLIEITLILNSSKTNKQRLESDLHSELIYGWDISQSVDRTFYRLKPIKNYESTIIVIENLNEVLLFSFETFLDLETKPNITDYSFKLKWVYLTYTILIQSLTLQQKAMIFSKYSNRKNRTYKLLHHYKDCIIGKQGVDFLVSKQICKNRKAGVALAQDFIDKGYMSHVENKHNYKDSNNCWYKFYDDNIQYHCDNWKRFSSMSVVVNEDCKINNENIYPSSDDDSIFIKHISNEIKQNAIQININKQKLNRLGTNHNILIEWLLSLYTINELQTMFKYTLKSLIKSPYFSIMNSSTNTVFSRCNSSDDDDNDAGNNNDNMETQLLDNNNFSSDDELFISYNDRMHLQMCNKYKLNVKPFSMRGITDKERKKLFSIQSMTFDTWLKALQFILSDLWDIYNDICKDIYFTMINDISLVEKAKILSIGVESKNRLKNLKKYRHCFIGRQAVTFMIKSHLAENRKTAVRLGNMFYQKKWLSHVKNEYYFQDKDFFYRMMEDEVENRLDELRMYRKQQQSNHVNISLDIVVNGDADEDSEEILIDYHDREKNIQYESSMQKDSISNMDYFPQKKHTTTKSTDLDVESYFED